MTDKSLRSQCRLEGIRTKHRFQKKSESLLKDLTTNPVLRSNVSGKPLKPENNETCTVSW